MKERTLREIIEGFHYGMDGGLPVDCAGVPAIEKLFDKWAKKHHPDIYENAGDLEAYMLDEEDIGVIADFFVTVPDKHLKAAMKGLAQSMESFYSEGPDPDGDDEEKVAAETLTKIRAYLGSSKKTAKKK